MSEDKSLKIFSKILAFGKELNDTFGNKYNNVRLYYKLLKKTPVANKSAISKHNYIFENFYNNFLLLYFYLPSYFPKLNLIILSFK